MGLRDNLALSPNRKMRVSSFETVSERASNPSLANSLSELARTSDI
jgi:hypothetical protein